jgi:hypothetical protein
VLRLPTDFKSLRKLHHAILSIKLILIEIASLVGFVYLLVGILRGEIHW